MKRNGDSMEYLKGCLGASTWGAKCREETGTRVYMAEHQSHELKGGDVYFVLYLKYCFMNEFGFF